MRPPSLDRLLKAASKKDRGKPIAVVLAGHNGSGKSTLWYERLVPILRMPLINADRLTLSILPPADQRGQLPEWANRLRDRDDRWQRLSQEGVQAFLSLIMEKRMPFAFETVFSHWQKRPDGTVESKADIIQKLQAEGYYVVLLFVGLSSATLSILRVAMRRQRGGHDVPLNRLRERYPRTQMAIGHAAPLADMTIMFDNSDSPDRAFTLVRAQQRTQVLFDCRDPRYTVARRTRRLAGEWLFRVAGPFK